MRLRDALHPRFLAQAVLLRPLLGAVFGVNVRGRENLEGLERFILISNHNSHLDTLLIWAALPAHLVPRTRPVAAREYWTRSPRLFRAVDALFHPVWVERGLAGAAEALAGVQGALDAGDNVLLFPEGTRGEPGRMQAFKGGIGRIVAANPEIPVVPVFLEGPERALPRRASVPIPLWNHVTIAPPQMPRGAARDITRSLERTLAALGAGAHAARQVRPPAREPSFTVAVLGVDGSGKSTLAGRLAAELSAAAGETCLISDRLELFAGGAPHEMQPLMTEKLRRWLGAQARARHSLAGYKIPKMAELLLRDRLLTEARRWYRPGLVVMDGMPLLNLVAWAMLYREEEFSEENCARLVALLSRKGPRAGRRDPLYRRFPELAQLRRLGLDHLQIPDAAILLDVAPEVCVRRIVERGEERQAHETAARLARLREGYLAVARVLARDGACPVLILDGGRDRECVAAEARDFTARERRPDPHDRD